jgi:hypothetical protein
LSRISPPAGRWRDQQGRPGVFKPAVGLGSQPLDFGLVEAISRPRSASVSRRSVVPSDCVHSRFPTRSLRSAGTAIRNRSNLDSARLTE